MFEKIVGNTKIKQIIEKAIEQNTVSHSYIFIGPQGIGKKMIAEEFAKKILCLDNKSENCKCKSCIEFNTSNNPDFSCIYPEGNNIKVEQIRNLQKKIQEKPIISDKKVYIIDDADTMTKEAQNCLLKTLEEPPVYATIILIGSNENGFLTTIKSRCIILNFKPISNKEMKEYFKNNLHIEENEEMLEVFEGSIGKAIKLKDKKNDYEKITKLIENLNKQDILSLYRLAEPLYKSKDEIFEILDYINILLLKRAKKIYYYAKCINTVERTKNRLKQNANYDMCIDNMIFNMWEDVN